MTKYFYVVHSMKIVPAWCVFHKCRFTMKVCAKQRFVTILLLVINVGEFFYNKQVVQIVVSGRLLE